jgi:primosomal protein DnaI
MGIMSMESIADILKSMPKSGRLFESYRQIRETLEHDPLIEKLKAKHPELDDHAIKLNMNRLYQYVTEHHTCSQCPGLEQCPNDYAGHYTRLRIETINEQVQVHDLKVPCKKQVAQEVRESVARRIRSFYVDEKALLEGYNIQEIFNRDGQRALAISQIVDFIDQVKQNGLTHRGLYLHGKFGTGKTFLACYLMHELAQQGMTGVIVYMPDFVEDLKLMFDEPQKMKETLDLLKETDIVVFDDIGAENLNPWVRDHVMGAILNYRMNRKPTFFTSNYDLDALQQHFSFTSKDGEDEFKAHRIMDRIRPYVDVVTVGGRNHRGE